MGFRNPLTTLSASQITPGTLPPGVTILTASSGMAWLLSSLFANSLTGLTGSPYEITPGTVTIRTEGAGTPAEYAVLEITAPRLLEEEQAQKIGLQITSAPHDGGDSMIQLLADFITFIGRTKVASDLEVVGPVAITGAAAALTLGGRDIPEGRLAFGTVTGPNAVSTVATARLTTILTPKAGRDLSLRAVVHIYNPGAGAFMSGAITRDGAQVGNITKVWHPGGGQVIRLAHEVDDLGPSADPHTYQYEIWASADTSATYDGADASLRITDDGGS